MTDTPEQLVSKITSGQIEMEMMQELASNEKMRMTVEECVGTLLAMIDEKMFEIDKTDKVVEKMYNETFRQTKTATFLYSFLRLLQSLDIITINSSTQTKKDMNQIAQAIFDKKFKK